MELTVRSCPDDIEKVTEVFMNTLNISWMTTRVYCQTIQQTEIKLTSTGWESFSVDSLIACFKELSALGCRCNLSTKGGTESRTILLTCKNRTNNKISQIKGLTKPMITAEQIDLFTDEEYNSEHNGQVEQYWLKNSRIADLVVTHYSIDYTIKPGDFKHGEIWEKQDGTMVIYNREFQRWYHLPMDRS